MRCDSLLSTSGDPFREAHWHSVNASKHACDNVVESQRGGTLITLITLSTRFKPRHYVSVWASSSKMSSAEQQIPCTFLLCLVVHHPLPPCNLQLEVDFGGSNQVVHFDSNLLEKAHRAWGSGGPLTTDGLLKCEWPNEGSPNGNVWRGHAANQVFDGSSFEG